MTDARGRELTAGGWDVVSQLLEEALTRPASQREAFLLGACGGDRTVVEEVVSLAAAHDAASQGDDSSGPLERLAAALNAAPLIGSDGSDDSFTGGDGDTRATRDPDATHAVGGSGGADRPVLGQRIGPYALVREIGRGGMGVVYLARRVDGQYDRDVALKLLRCAAYDARRRERFLAERQFLAMLSHPNIARMFDGGVTAAGQPFFTMDTSMASASIATARNGAPAFPRASGCSCRSATPCRRRTAASSCTAISSRTTCS